MLNEPHQLAEEVAREPGPRHHPGGHEGCAHDGHAQIRDGQGHDEVVGGGLDSAAPVYNEADQDVAGQGRQRQHDQRQNLHHHRRLGGRVGQPRYSAVAIVDVGLAAGWTAAGVHRQRRHIAVSSAHEEKK